MNKIFKSAMFFAAAAVMVAFTSCGSDDDGSGNTSTNTNTGTTTEVDPQNLDYSSELAAAWGNYAYNVALLLNDDATTLYNAWNDEYAVGFKSADASVTGFSSSEACVEQIIDGCIDIAGEVGEAKIGDPVEKWNAGKTTEALYAVESWYSWHSRDDYKNNILSIANSLYGDCISETKFQSIGEAESTDFTIANSIMAVGYNNSAVQSAAADAWNKTIAAWNAIDAIPQPFRNNIGSAEAVAAMDACAELKASLETLKGVISNFSEIECGNITAQYVDNVVMPTYLNLKNKNAALLTAVKAFQAAPSNDTFENACSAWMAARQPWETSEAFLFGPVDELGLDPNMDSWPLDATGIYNLLKSQQWADMKWSDGDTDEAVESAQALRGFHTLEYLLFKDGKPRTVN